MKHVMNERVLDLASFGGVLLGTGLLFAGFLIEGFSAITVPGAGMLLVGLLYGLR